LLSGRNRRHFFELANGRVAVAAIVAEFGAAHRVTHLFGRMGNRIGAKVDHV
jgi:hypothetical protein